MDADRQAWPGASAANVPASVFTGCLDAESQHVLGDEIYHSANYYVPMLLTYLGARRNEITVLAVNDVKETANGWAIDIRISKGQERPVPENASGA